MEADMNTYPTIEEAIVRGWWIDPTDGKEFEIDLFPDDERSDPPNE
jgi:hypothetical protein